jgi:hypothetical protein
VDPGRLLYAARLELARRGDPRYAPLLRRVRMVWKEVDVPPDLPAEKVLEHVLRGQSEPARKALRELLEALSAAPSHLG